MINELAKQVHQNAKDKGFFDNGKATNIGERLALIHSEVSEALEADRKGAYVSPQAMYVFNKWFDEKVFKQEYTALIKGSFEEEMADIVIRVMDMCAWKGIDLEKHIELKMKYNSLREKMHGKKY